MKKKILLILFIAFSSFIYADQNKLLKEYRLLFTDLSNVEKWGYKSFFNPQYNRASENINISQGALIYTGVNTHFAIAGEGFFRIRLENNKIGYTRYGAFQIDANGNLVTAQGYFFYENINLNEGFLLQTLKVTRDGIVTVTIAGNRNILTEKEIGRLLTYNIPYYLLKHYKGSIYVIKEYLEYHVEIATNNSINQGFLELSNVRVLAVALRMYYILSVIDDNLISNRNFRRELLKMQINRMANHNYLLVEILFSLNNRINDIVGILFDNNLLHEKLEIFGQEISVPRLNFIYSHDIMQNYLNRRFDFLMHILPYLRYDY